MQFKLIRSAIGEDFSAIITKELNSGAILHGNSFYDGRCFCQAVIYKDKIDNLPVH